MSTTQADIYGPFASDAFIRVERIEVATTPRPRVRFSDGAVRKIDLSETIARSKWFRNLSAQTTFETVEIIEGGHALQWINGADYFTDALRILADKQLHGIA